MTMEPDNWSGLSILGGRRGGRDRGKPKGRQDLYLCVALVVLLVWALFVGLGR